nr:MAG TPA: hypothetical protein [Caudoviricetes sp.]
MQSSQRLYKKCIFIRFFIQIVCIFILFFVYLHWDRLE